MICNSVYSQTCPAPSINAQAGTGPSTTICSGLCANLTATVVPVNSTTSYSVGSVAYAPFAYAGGVAAIGAADDVWSNVINIGFSFCYFGNNFTQLIVGSNGEISFNLANAGLGENFTVNNILPNTAEHPVNTICGPYRDIDPSAGGNVRTYTTGVAPCRKFVAYWSNVPMYGCAASFATFQIVLHESSNIIEVNVQNSTACAAWQNGKGLIGIQDATAATAVAPATRNVLTPWTGTNESWRFTPTGAPTFTVNWAGPSGFTATGLTATPCPTATSTYTATMSLSECTGGTITTFTSAVQVSVTPTPTIIAAASPTAICIGGSTTLTATGATSYTWQPGNLAGPSVIVAPGSTTIYTVTGQSGICSSTSTVQVVVNSTVSASASPASVCSGASATLTGFGAATYTWNPGNITGNPVVVTPTATTVYSVSGTNPGCTSSNTVMVTVTPGPSVSAFNLSGTVCAGTTASLVATGALTYTWNPGNIVGNIVTVTPTVNTTYTVVGSVGSCTSQATILVSVNSGPTITVVSSPTLTCPGNSATLTASGALSYTWNPGAIVSNSIVVSPLVTTTYSVTGVNALGCQSTFTVNHNVSPIPSITITPASPSVCAGSSATLTASGASTYTWNPGSLTGASVVVSPATNTTYTIVGSNGTCTNSATALLTVVPVPTVSASSSTTQICSGGTVTLNASGATSYTWNPGALSGGTVVASPTVTTTFTVTGSSASCSNSAIVTVTVNAGPAIAAAASPTSICAGSSSTLSASGALSYTWNPGALAGGTVTVSPAATTIYSVTGNNALGCLATTTLNLLVSPNPTVIASVSPATICVGSTATLTGSGATTYTWNPGGLSGPSVTVSPASTTIYTVTGANGACTNTQTVSLTVTASPTITASGSPTLICSGSSATLTGSGAASYTWNPGALSGTSVTVSPTVSTTYTVTGANVTGCKNTATVSITVNPSPTVSATSSPTAMCIGATATLSGSGATTYTWNPGGLSGTSVTVSPASTTIYTVTGTAAGCSSSSTVQLVVSPIPTVSASSNPVVICSGATATLTGSGAASYTWNPGALSGGTVTVNPTVTTTYTVTGATAGCSATSTLILTVNPSPTVTAAASPTAICSGNTATLSASGATSYTWIPGPIIGGTVTVSPTINTTYTVRGSNGTCTGTTSVLLTVIPSPTVSATSSPTAICTGATATLTGTGATSYTWNPGGLSGPSVTVSPASTTIYTVTGANGICINTKTVSLTVSPTPTVSAVSNPTVICSGNTATLTGSGATSYTWNPGALSGINVTVSPAATTVYTVTGTGAGGCTSTGTVSLTVNGTPTLTASSNPTTLCSGNTATLTGTGATSYTWNPGALSGATVTVSPGVTTTYTLTGTNGTGCTSTKTITLNVTTTPTVSASVSPTVICAGSTATLSGIGAATYTWNPGALSGATVAVTPTATTIYTLTGANGTCSNTKTVSLSVIASPTVIASASPTAICSGASSTLSASGATSYTWNPGALAGPTATVTPAATTVYTVTGINGSGCTNSQTVV
ncbi:MAG: beta strand repeat-containing protein, partial [Bacteroidia bacterium]